MQAIDIGEAPARRDVQQLIKRYVFWAAAAIVVGLDQLTKSIIRASLERGEDWPSSWPVHFTYVTNTGAAFGILEDKTVFLAVMATIGLGAIYLYYRNPPFQHWSASVAIGMMLGGALGNLIDRVRLGRVTDWIQFPHYPSFNVADSSIFIGVSIILIGYLLFGEHNQPPARADEAPSHEDAPAEG